ncbi:MAG: response regulator [Ardenticatenia bacterium]|nr:MAG: response regulator [Ardenticatenia bacterium]
MSRTYRILVVDDDWVSAELVRRVLERVGYEAFVVHSPEDALNALEKEMFDAAILDVMLPGMDGFTLARRIRQDPKTRLIPILMLTSMGDLSDKIAGFEAGVDDYVTKPFDSNELVYRLRALLLRAEESRGAGLAQVDRSAAPRGKVIAVFGTKGGVGKTLISVNLSIALQQKTQKRVAIFDADLLFGDVGVHLNLPTVRSIVDLIDQIDSLDEYAEQVLVPHSSGVYALLSPFRPEEAELVTAEHIGKVLEWLQTRFDYVVVDCPPAYDDRVLVVLEKADVILIVVTPEIGPLKNMSVFLDLAEQLGLSYDKIHLILNRANSNVGINVQTIERTLRHRVALQVVSGGRAVVLSVNRGVPIVLDHPNALISQQIRQIADFVLEQIRQPHSTR